MSSMMHKIADAISGHSTSTTNTTGTTTGSNPTSSTTSSQVRDTNTAHNATTGAQHTAAYDSYQQAPNSLAGSLGAQTAGASYNRDTATSTTNSGLQSSSSSSLKRPTASTTTGDDAMTLSEEHLLVSKEQVPAGKVGLNKYVTTEKVHTTVPVVKEHAVIEREPITEANREAALRGPDFKESHHEVQLMEERVVAQKEEVPIERVRLRKEQEQTEQYVEAELRKEHVDVDGARGVAAGKQYQAGGLTSGTSQTAALDATSASGNARRKL